MPRTRRAPAQAPATRRTRRPAPEVEAAVETPITEPTEPTEPIEAPADVVEPEVPFGQDADDESDLPPIKGPTGNATVVFGGVKGKKGIQPIAITVIVPDDGSGYEDFIISGRTYTLRLNQPSRVESDDVEWLTKHPTFDIKQP